MSDAATQATVISKYLIARKPTPAMVALYESMLESAPDSNETRLLNFAFKHTWLLGSLDGALAFVHPDSELRRRIYTMFAILEASPEYAELFLAKQRSPIYLLVVGLTGVKAILRAVCGVLVIKIWRLT